MTNNYFSGCGHCVEAKPEFSRAADELAKKGSKVKLYAVEASENAKVADFAALQSLPTFKLYISGTEVADYEGSRTADDMVEFCKKYDKVKDEL